MLLCEKTDNKSKENYLFQFYHAPLYLDRFEALNKTGADYEENSPSGKMMEDGLADSYWNIRVQALKNIGTQVKANKERLKPVTKPKPEVPAAASEPAKHPIGPRPLLPIFRAPIRLGEDIEPIEDEDEFQ